MGIMELTKADKAQLKGIIKRGILRRCEQWLKETSQLINEEYDEQENAFDRCMEITRRSRDFYKEAMQRENYYNSSIMISGVGILLTEGYLTSDDFAECREDVKAAILRCTTIFI